MKAGKPVELTVKSVTWVVPHNVIIDDPRSGLKNREEVPAGESLTIKFTPTVHQPSAIYCDKKLPFFKSHREKGQEGVLEVRWCTGRNWAGLQDVKLASSEYNTGVMDT